MRRESFACFNCKVSFKQDGSVDERPCPNCNGIMYRMGWSFKAPRKHDKDQWKKVQILYAEGFRFFGSGNYESQPLPELLKEVSDFLKRNPDHRLRVADRRPDLIRNKL